ncbi:uncharacterized protein LOC142590836 [Dermacentor variabilis]|uniref:uncharacterized protein LOC142590836 n=1 Tax=Dermacentor variabilis TaxID=34621 RepID=UPI003F5C12DF
MSKFSPPTPDSISTDRNALNILCTKKNGASCCLMKHRRDLNKVLVSAGLELREDPRGKNRGDVLIACVEANTPRYALHGSGQASRKSEAPDLVEHLLAEHRCITAIELTFILTVRRSMLSAIMLNPSLKRITVCGSILPPWRRTSSLEVFNPIPLHEYVAFEVHDFKKESGDGMPLPGRSLFSGMGHLTALDIADLQMDKNHARWFIRELIENKSITELAVGESVFGYCDEASNAVFARYLAKEDSTLSKLTLKSPDFSDRGKPLIKTLLIEIVEAISEMNTLKELNAVIVVDDPLFIFTVTLFAEVIKRNNTLRRLRLPSSMYVCLKSSWDPDKQFPDPQAATCMKSLCEALHISNSSLSQLSIDLRPFEEAECHAFFGAVADNNAIKSVVVNCLPCIDGIDRVATTIRERGLDDRVVVKSFCIHHNIMQLQQCPQIYNATIASSNTISNVPPSVMTALRFVCGCKHVTSLCVHTDGFKCYEFSSLAAYIRVSSTLSEVDIHLTHEWDCQTNQEIRDVEQQLVYALASNLNLVRINVEGLVLFWEDLIVLAHCASKSLSLIEFTGIPASIFNAMHHDTRGEVRSYSVHKAEAFREAANRKESALLDILEVTKKNASAILDAAQFVRGEKGGVEGIRALELMQNHPRFLEMVREEAEATKTEAKKIIRRALLRAQNCSLDQFMKMVGVVKDAVECPSDAGLRLQLVDLNHDCWLHIRSFLKIVDVLPKRGNEGKGHLTALNIADLEMDKVHARWFIRELIENKSITELAVGESVFGYCDEASNAVFARYLAIEDSTLRKLTLKSPHIYDRPGSDLMKTLFMQIIEAISEMNTLKEFNADIVMDNALL